MKELPVIFLAFANDQQDGARYLRGLARELRQIRKTLQAASRAGQVELVERANANLADIIDVFQNPQYAGRIKIFHYGGHAGSYELLLESDRGEKEIAGADGLARLLAGQKSLELVFLNGCSTLQQSQKMLNEGIPQTITTTEDINDETALEFAVRFYAGLAGHATISKAFNDAQNEQLTRATDTSRGLTWRVLDAAPSEEMPWKLLPKSGSDWRLPGFAEPSASPDLKLGDYAHTLLDRHEQTNNFVSRYIPSSRERMPKIYISHGAREDKHNSLISRFSYEHIGSSKQFIQPIDLGRWPVAGDGKMLLRLNLVEQFEALGEMKNELHLKAEDVLSLRELMGKKSIIFRYNLAAEHWKDTTAELLHWYIGSFWDVEATEAEAPHIVIFINVFYSEELEKEGFFQRLFSNKYDRDRIIGELEDVAEKNKKNCTLLPQLNQLTRPHLEDWIIDSQLGDSELFSALTDMVFPPEKAQTLPMADVESHVKKALKAYKQENARKQM